MTVNLRLLVMVPSTTYSYASHLHLLMRKVRIGGNRLGLITSKWQNQDSNIGLCTSKAFFFFFTALLTLHDQVHVWPGFSGPQICPEWETSLSARESQFSSVISPASRGSGRMSDHLQLPGRLIPPVQASAARGKARPPKRLLA